MCVKHAGGRRWCWVAGFPRRAERRLAGRRRRSMVTYLSNAPQATRTEGKGERGPDRAGPHTVDEAVRAHAGVRSSQEGVPDSQQRTPGRPPRRPPPASPAPHQPHHRPRPDRHPWLPSTRSHATSLHVAGQPDPGSPSAPIAEHDKHTPVLTQDGPLGVGRGKETSARGAYEHASRALVLWGVAFPSRELTHTHTS